jgi:hypothetical protein
MPGKVKPIELGTRFGRLEVLDFVGVINKHAIWRCKCDCGKFVNRDGSQMRYGYQKSCGCWCGKRRPYESTYNMLVHAAIRRNKPCSLTYEEFLTFIAVKKCHYCNENVVWKMYADQKTNRNNLDRKDNNVGYSLDNCLVCCYSCNVTKGDRFSYEEFLQLSIVIRDINEQRRKNEE